MELLYRGFDGLDVSFAGRISEKLCRALLDAKEQAQETHQPSILMWNGVALEIGESGARGGYVVIASTGSLGATWFFKRPRAGDPWGVRVSCRSGGLATKGLGATRAELYQTMQALGVELSPEGESLSRVDYALDFLMPEFALVPDHFVMHSNASRADNIELPDMRVNGRSGRVSSVTIGKMPGRQVIVYDKRAEVIARHKVGWWTIWNEPRTVAGLPPLDPADRAQSQVWRVELRAGKSHLKESWNLRRWADLDDRLGDLMAAMLKSIRHCTPNGDSNRSRWPDSQLWQSVASQLSKDLFEMASGAAPDLVKRVELEFHDALLGRQMTGLLTTRAALHGLDLEQLPSFAKFAGNEMCERIKAERDHYAKKLLDAKARYDLGVRSR